MAIASCGAHWSWDSPMWCAGKKIDETKNNQKVDTMCVSCPWYVGNNKDESQDL